MNHSYLRESVHLLLVPEDLQHAGTYGTTGSWKGVRGHGLFQNNFQIKCCVRVIRKELSSPVNIV